MGPLELLAPKDREEPLLSTVFGPVFCGTFGFVAGCLINVGARRPVFSGIQKHVGLAGIGIVAGSYLEKERALYLAERDAVLRHYIELHPEDFPTPERKKYADVFRAWIPIR